MTIEQRLTALEQVVMQMTYQISDMCLSISQAVPIKTPEKTEHEEVLISALSELRKNYVDAYGEEP